MYTRSGFGSIDDAPLIPTPGQIWTDTDGTVYLWTGDPITGGTGWQLMFTPPTQQVNPTDDTNAPPTCVQPNFYKDGVCVDPFTLQPPTTPPDTGIISTAPAVGTLFTDSAGNVKKWNGTTWELVTAGPTPPAPPPPPPKGCATDTFTCPDGTVLSRALPTCDFPPCPTPKKLTPPVVPPPPTVQPVTTAVPSWVWIAGAGVLAFSLLGGRR